MEINPSDYTAQYLTIWFLCQWFFIVTVWRTASLIIPYVWSTAGESIVMIEFFWTWLRRQLHFASHFQDVFFFFLSSAFFSSFSDGRKFDHIKPCLSSFSIPWGASAAESPRDNKGKNIKAHKQDTHTHTARRKERKCVHLQMCACVCACFKTHTGLCKWLWACMCARIHKELEFRAFTRCSCVCLVGSW